MRGDAVKAAGFVALEQATNGSFARVVCGQGEAPVLKFIVQGAKVLGCRARTGLRLQALVNRPSLESKPLGGFGHELEQPCSTNRAPSSWIKRGLHLRHPNQLGRNPLILKDWFQLRNILLRSRRPGAFREFLIPDLAFLFRGWIGGRLLRLPRWRFERRNEQAKLVS